MALDPIPQARLVKQAGQLFAPPPAPKTQPPSQIGQHLKNALNVALGLWPLTGVMLLMLGLLIMAGNGSVK
ncbi:MAG TPA: hypothetical protein VFQ53_17075 [Kofleriaceae bacterium]|nr:hypothetical protein [Kofleriaceae bacterium]